MSESDLKQAVLDLKLYGLLAHWDELSEADMVWVNTLVQWESAERHQRGLDRRLRNAHLTSFKALADFDWDWPKQCDREAITDLMTLRFIGEVSNVVLMGPNGVGKSTIAQNLAYQAVMKGYTVLFVSASQLLGDLVAREGDTALQRRLKHYGRPQLLVIDELGYLSYGTRHADLLFEVISRRYEQKSTIVTTNKPFAEWGEVFPNAACVVSLVDRLVHHAEIISIEGESYRMKEATERAAKKRRNRRKPSNKGNTT